MSPVKAHFYLKYYIEIIGSSTPENRFCFFIHVLNDIKQSGVDFFLNEAVTDSSGILSKAFLISIKTKYLFIILFYLFITFSF